MSATKPRHLLPAAFIMVSALTLVACSDSSTTSAKIEEQSNTLLDQAQQAADQVKTEMTETAQSAIDDAHTAVQESVATATDAATETAASAKNSVTETGRSAVTAMTEKAAETKAVVSEKIAALAPATTLSHADGLELAKKSGCLACHSIDKKLMGPAWRDVANKYRGQSDAKTNLISSIARGSRGNWGTVPMPANSPRISTDNIAALAEFVLSIE